MSIKENVQKYYGETLQSTDDLKTSACCPADAIPDYIKPYIANIESEIIEKFYGCGSPIPQSIEGLTVLDLGCGTGRDVYILSQMVGQNGRVIGVDMTENQINVAKKYQTIQSEKFNHKTPNTEFILGNIEDLAKAGIKDNSVDLVVSNCVINLSNNKEQVFKEIHRILKPGGELYFSDVYSDRRIPEKVKNDETIYGECLGGALYTNDFRRIMAKVGFNDYRIMSNSIIDISDEKIKNSVGNIKFYSQTIRTFKCDFEDRCEDYGQFVIYNGGGENPHIFNLDPDHQFIAHKPELVCSNSAMMVQETRFSKFFKVHGDTSIHFGEFDCGGSNPTDDENIGGCC